MAFIHNSYLIVLRGHLRLLTVLMRKAFINSVGASLNMPSPGASLNGFCCFRLVSHATSRNGFCYFPLAWLRYLPLALHGASRNGFLCFPLASLRYFPLALHGASRNGFLRFPLASLRYFPLALHAASRNGFFFPSARLLADPVSSLHPAKVKLCPHASLGPLTLIYQLIGPWCFCQNFWASRSVF